MFGARNASAQVEVLESRLLPADIAIECTLAWPTGLEQGYLPIQVELIHEGQAPAEVIVTVFAGRWGHHGETYARRELQIEPGERAQFELLVPRFIQNNRHLHTPFIEFTAGKTSLSLTPSGRASTSNENTFGCLVVTKQAASAGTNEALESALEAGLPAPLPGAGHITFGFNVRAATWDDLPSAWQAYSSLDLVVLDSNDRQALGQHLGPILAWVRLGGKLALIGDSSALELGEIPGLENAFETRRSIRDRKDLYSYGLGQLQVKQQGFERESSMRTAVAGVADLENLADMSTRWVPHPIGWRLRTNPKLKPLSPVPLRGFLAALLLFAFLIGPLHLIVLRRINRPGVMLISIPVLSLMATGAVLAYGIWEQGLDTKVRNQSLSVLDQGSKRVGNLVRRDIFAGGLGGATLRPAVGTAVFPIVKHSRLEKGYELERSDEGLVLSGGFLPTRTQVQQWVASEQASRIRLSVEPAPGGGVEITNAGTVKIEDLYYRSLEDTWYRVTDLEPGAKQVASLGRFFESKLKSRLESAFRESLPVLPGGYVALLEQDPFMDDLGLDWNVQEGEYFLLGLIEAKEAL